MALFSGNRKVRSRRPKSALEAAQEVSSPRSKTRHLTKRADALNGQIERLECFIANAPRLERQHRLANINMVPPMELSSPARQQRRVPIAQQRARRGIQVRMLTEGLFILAAIAGVVGWLNQWFHFWS